MKLIFSLLLAMTIMGCSAGNSGGIAPKTPKIEVEVAEPAEAQDAARVIPVNISDAQCVLTKYDHVTGLSSQCSGTYLNKNVFLTAASCFDILDAGLDLSKNTRRQYTVRCQNQTEKKISSVAIHPQFFTNDVKIYSGYETDVIDPDDMIHVAKYNDMALAWTDAVELEGYPSLPNSNGSKIEANKNDVCSFEGYGVDHCDPDTKAGCRRRPVEPASDQAIVKVSECNLLTGENCFLSRSEKSSTKQPLAYAVGVKYGRGFSVGDAGSAMICKTDDKDVVVGVVAGLEEPQSKISLMVNASNKLNFINQFLKYDQEEFLQNSETYVVSDSYKERVRLEQLITAVFADVLDVKLSKVYISKNSISEAHMFLQYAEENKAKVTSYLRENDIKAISFIEDSRSAFMRFSVNPETTIEKSGTDNVLVMMGNSTL